MKEEEARRALKVEEEARQAEKLLPESEVNLLRAFSIHIANVIAQLQPDKVEEPEIDARMTTEQVKELGEALSILSAKSSVLKERQELRALMDENLQADEVRTLLRVTPFND